MVRTRAPRRPESLTDKQVAFRVMRRGYRAGHDAVAYVGYNTKRYGNAIATTIVETDVKEFLDLAAIELGGMHYPLNEELASLMIRSASVTIADTYLKEGMIDPSIRLYSATGTYNTGHVQRKLKKCVVESSNNLTEIAAAMKKYGIV